MKIFTIGFTKKNAENFFSLLKRPGLARVVDIRLRNDSQLAGFAKQDDLRYFLREICGVDYVRVLELAPTEEILDGFKKNKGDWAVYEKKFLDLLKSRKVEKILDRATLDGGCLLCSEATPDRCHRRLVAEYLKKHWGDVEILHL